MDLSAKIKVELDRAQKFIDSLEPSPNRDICELDIRRTCIKQIENLIDEVSRCPVCQGRFWNVKLGKWVASRETKNGVCQTCGRDYSGGVTVSKEELSGVNPSIIDTYHQQIKEALKIGIKPIEEK